jgi:predicted nucleic acid-binding Zn ribbon protein
MHKKSNESGLKDALELYLKHFKLLNGYHQAAIVSIWDRLMGPTIATKTEQISYKDGLLSIRFSSPVLRQEMQFVKEKIKDSLNKELGKRVIQEVKIL